MIGIAQSTAASGGVLQIDDLVQRDASRGVASTREIRAQLGRGALRRGQEAILRAFRRPGPGMLRGRGRGRSPTSTAVAKRRRATLVRVLSLAETH